MANHENGRVSHGRTILGRCPSRRPRLCIVAPCYNEEDVIELFYRELKSVLDSMTDVEHLILFVDDGSTDDTCARLNAIAADDPRVRVCSLSRNFGHQIALSAGLDHARGDAVILLDSDLQHPPQMIPALVDRWRQGDDVVLTVRRHTADASWFKRVSSNAFYWLFNKMADVQLVYGAADFCLLSRRVYRALRRMPERHRFLRGMVAWVGFPRSAVPYTSPPRPAGRSKYTLARMLRLAAQAILSFTPRPIFLAMQAGALATLAGLAYLGFILLGHFRWGSFVPGWSSVICTILIFGGLQLLATGLIGGYVACIFEQVKGRPVYLLKQPPRRATRMPRREIPKRPHYLIKKELDLVSPTRIQGVFPRCESGEDDVEGRQAGPRRDAPANGHGLRTRG